MSKFDGALIKEQGVTFAIAMVKGHVFNNPNREQIRNKFSVLFGNVPVVLARNTSGGRIEYHGRNDLVKFLSRIHTSQIPWKSYTLS